MEQWILLAMAPVFLGLIALEAWYWRRRRPGMYSWADTLSNASLALLHQGADALAWALVIGLYYVVYQHRLFELPASAWSIAALFVAQDFLYYWFHRAHHRIRWMWASHVTHHSSERLNLSTAFRQSLTYPLSGMWLFWLPLAWIGFEPTRTSSPWWRSTSASSSSSTPRPSASSAGSRRCSTRPRTTACTTPATPSTSTATTPAC
jgi:sterol desaturase/sphingolipid hydroxylase (fatty acid hydroxylase superfamily)